MPSNPEGFKCIRCGACCRSFIPVTRQDVMRWAVQGRDDILEHISTREMFVQPVSRDEFARCPFLREKLHLDVYTYTCSIHDTKPAACAEFPTSLEQIERMGCPGIPQKPDQSL